MGELGGIVGIRRGDVDVKVEEAAFV